MNKCLLCKSGGGLGCDIPERWGDWELYAASGKGCPLWEPRTQTKTEVGS